MTKVLNNNINRDKKNSSSDTRRFKCDHRIFWLCGFISIMTILLFAIIFYLKFNNTATIVFNVVSNQTDFQEESTSTLNETLSSDPNFVLKIVSRLEWFALPPTEPPNILKPPVSYVIIHHTATENCSSQAQCVFHVRIIQNFHIESRKWWDIGYNFLVGGDEEAYEGRGWKAEGAHTLGYNNNSIGIAFIGTFNTIKPPERQITACKLLISKGVGLGYIKKDYKLLAAKQLRITKSPGEKLYEDMKTWDNWVAAP